MIELPASVASGVRTCTIRAQTKKVELTPNADLVGSDFWLRVMLESIFSG